VGYLDAFKLTIWRCRLKTVRDLLELIFSGFVKFPLLLKTEHFAGRIRADSKTQDLKTFNRLQGRKLRGPVARVVLTSPISKLRWCGHVGGGWDEFRKR
jgi:hypothetical protein